MATIPSHWVQLCDESVMTRAIRRMSLEIVEKDTNLSSLALVGVRSAGDVLARRVRSVIQELEGVEVACGTVDITLYRDDIVAAETHPTLVASDLPFRVTDSRVVLVDDLLFTGRTVRAAMDAVVDFGRPSCVELACLIDRGHCEFPITPNYVGRKIPTRIDESIKVRPKEIAGFDAIYLVPEREPR